MPTVNVPILIVDDDELFVEYLQTLLEGYGHQNIHTAFSGKESLRKVEETEYALILLDLLLPDISGLDILQHLHSQYPDLPVVIITSEDRVETAVECMKAGAFDFLTKPIQEARLLPILRHALTILELKAKVDHLERSISIGQIRNPEAFRDIITRSDLMYEIFLYIETIAPTPKPVLITGESGTGKELIARTVHCLSGRTGKFIPVNVSGLDDTLFADSLFGHVKGAYSGAETHRNGLVQEASEGTLFLDEIGDLELSSQVKLLRLLQEGEYYRLGSDTPLHSSARILVATNADLYEKIRGATFRADLYYRLAAHRIELPPLRDRKEDIPLLIEVFVQRAATELKKPVPQIPDTLLPLFTAYSFPGNIRELQSLLYDAVSRTEGKELNLKPLLSYLAKQPAPSAKKLFSGSSLLSTEESIPTIAEVENTLIRKALERTGGNQSAASKLLGISQSTLSRWIQRYAK